MALVLFFDTETTGVPLDYKASPTNTDNWPRLVQLGALLVDEDTHEIIESLNEIVKPVGFEIPTAASDVHGITTEFAISHGKDLLEVITKFDTLLSRAQYIVGHNINFDINIVASEYVRLNLDYTKVTSKPNICTMMSSIEFCHLPATSARARGGFKWPRLQELHKACFGHEFEDAHDAFADITATKDCYFYLRENKVI